MACSEVAFVQSAGAHYISNNCGQCRNSLAFAARQIANNLSPIAKKFEFYFLGLSQNIIRKNV